MNKPSMRMIELLSLLQGGRAWPAADLANRLGTTPRTLRRDLDRLRELGYPVESTRGPGGSYRLVAGRAMPPLVLTDEEAIAAVVGLRFAAQLLTDDAADGALRKLEQVLPPRLRRRMEALSASTHAVTRARLDPKVVEALGTAAHEHHEVRFRYTDRTARESTRHVEPYRQVLLDRRWYLLAWDLTRNDWRTFRTDRIKSVETLPSTFAPREPLPDTMVHRATPATATGNPKGTSGSGKVTTRATSARKSTVAMAASREAATDAATGGKSAADALDDGQGTANGGASTDRESDGPDASSRVAASGSAGQEHGESGDSAAAGGATEARSATRTSGATGIPGATRVSGDAGARGATDTAAIAGSPDGAHDGAGAFPTAGAAGDRKGAGRGDDTPGEGSAGDASWRAGREPGDAARASGATAAATTAASTPNVGSADVGGAADGAGSLAAGARNREGGSAGASTAPSDRSGAAAALRERGVVRFAAPVAEVSVRLVAEAGSLEPIDAQNCRYISPPDDWEWLAITLAMVGVPYTVEAPPALIDQTRRLAARITAATQRR